MKGVAGSFAPETVQRQVEIGVVPFHGTYQFSDSDFRVQFLLDFAVQRLLSRFPGFNFSARELPSVLEFAISALRGKNLVSASDDGCNNLYIFHIPYLEPVKTGHKFT